jgi:hypothetical protein
MFMADLRQRKAAMTAKKLPGLANARPRIAGHDRSLARRAPSCQARGCMMRRREPRSAACQAAAIIRYFDVLTF